MKSRCIPQEKREIRSRPAWGGWIEIIRQVDLRILMQRPAPHGAGGLKYMSILRWMKQIPSRPAWGGWIEIGVWEIVCEVPYVPPRMGRVD